MTELDIKLNKTKILWETLTDELRWKALPSLQLDIPKLLVMLDNDNTYIINTDENSMELILEFDDYIGWSEGVQTLLHAFNIKAEPV